MYNTGETEEQKFFNDLYLNYKGLMFYTARQYSTDTDAVEDIVQNALVRLIRKVETLQALSECCLCAYVVYTVKSAALDHCRKLTVQNRKNSDLDENDLQEVPDLAPLPEELVLQKETAERLQEVLNSMSVDDQLILRGKYVLQLNDGELAELLHCKQDSIRMKLTRARRAALAKLRGGCTCD